MRAHVLSGRSTRRAFLRSAAAAIASLAGWLASGCRSAGGTLRERRAVQQGRHYGSTNTLAPRMAGLDASVPDPVGGVIERDARGEPTGVFYNHRAMDMLRKVIPPPDPAITHDNLVAAQPVFAAVGVTTFHDNNVRGVDTVHSYLDVRRAGDMLIKGRVYHTLECPGDVKRARDEIRRDGGDEYMRFAGLKPLHRHAGVARLWGAPGTRLGCANDGLDLASGRNVRRGASRIPTT